MLQGSLIIPPDFPTAHWTRIFFYKLIDPITSEICYVGKTEDPAKRYKQHCRAGYLESNAYKTLWVSNLVFVQNQYPIMEVFAWVDNSMLDLGGCKHERHLIDKLWNEGHPLLNRNPKRKHGTWEARIRNARFYERNIFQV